MTMSKVANVAAIITERLFIGTSERD